MDTGLRRYDTVGGDGIGAERVRASAPKRYRWRSVVEGIVAGWAEDAISGLYPQRRSCYEHALF